MTTETRPIVAAVAVALLTFGTVLTMIDARGHTDELLYAAAAVQAVLAVWAWRIASSANRIAFWVLIATAVAVRLFLVVQPPILSVDLYRYIWDGRVVNGGFNPYTHIPADPALAHLRDPALYDSIDKKDYAVTIYPPVAQAIFAAVARVSPSIAGIKLAMTLFEAMAVFAVLTLMRRRGLPIAGLFLYLLNPASIWEIAGNGHVDAVAMAFLFGAFAWTRMEGGRWAAGLMLALGSLAKPTAAFGLPAVWRPFEVRLPLFVVAVVALCYAPFMVTAGGGVIGFLPQYAREQGLDNGQGILWLSLLEKAGLSSPALFTAYAVVVPVALLGLALVLRRNGRLDTEAQMATTAVLLIAAALLSTPVYPWYFLPALPFVVLLGLWSPFVLGSFGFLLYTFHDETTNFMIRWVFVYLVALLVAIRDIRHLKRRGLL